MVLSRDSEGIRRLHKRATTFSIHPSSRRGGNKDKGEEERKRHQVEVWTNPFSFSPSACSTTNLHPPFKETPMHMLLYHTTWVTSHHIIIKRVSPKALSLSLLICFWGNHLGMSDDSPPGVWPFAWLPSRKRDSILYDWATTQMIRPYSAGTDSLLDH